MKPYVQRLSIILVLLFVSVSLGLFFIPKPSLLKDMSFSQAIYDENHRLLRLTLSKDDKYRLYTPLKEISPLVVETTLLQEDQYFRWHYGVNPLAIMKAAWQTYGVKSRRMGGSTISMQLARIRYHIHSKTFAGKCWQMIRAMQIELHYSKNEILEAYLNLAPYGNNIEGVGAASLIYFAKPAAQITLPEALTLSVIPQNPTQRIPTQKSLKEIRNKLFVRWLELHPEDKNKQSLIELPLQMQTARSLPFLAPHFVNSVLRKSLTDQAVITTLNLDLQKMIEHVASLYLQRKRNQGIYNAAVLLVDTRDMSVKALMGSGDFFNKTIAGQINGIEARRSPGSTLKPFIYGLALDEGIIHPHSILKDVPQSFGNYNPENFDYDFMGPVKAKEALVLSRNIPAIDLASQLTKTTLYQLLQQAQIHHLKSEKYYGLSLVLGSAELTMEELTSLYAMLENEGLWHPLRYQKDDPFISRKRLLSAEASFLVLDMLKNTPRIGLDAIGQRSLAVAWKTGTSSGYRDAWTLGTFGPYALAVWVGNFNNVGNHAFVGKNIASPLFFELVEAIQSEIGPLPVTDKHPEKMNLIHIPVCKASGMLPTRFCKETEMTWFIPGKSPIQSDTIFREVAINNKTGLRTCQMDENTRFEIYEFWPSDLLKIFKEAGMKRRTPPVYDASCSLSSMQGFSPRMTSPRANLAYVVRAQAMTATQIPLSAIADADVTTLHWFLNEAYLGKTPRDHALLWQAKPGKFTVRVVDDHGRSDARDLVVRVES